MQPTRLFALLGLTHDQIADVDDVAQLADLTRGLGTLEQTLCLFVEYVKSVPRPIKAKIGADYSHVCAHDLSHLLGALSDQHHLFGVGRSFIVPVGHIGAQIVAANSFAGMAGRSIRIDNGLDKRIGSQSIASMKSGARKQAHF